MTASIRQAIAGDASLAGVGTEQVRVVAVSGHVTLSGYVPTLADKVAIEQRAREVKGVEGVTNDLQVLH